METRQASGGSGRQRSVGSRFHELQLSQAIVILKTASRRPARRVASSSIDGGDAVARACVAEGDRAKAVAHAVAFGVCSAATQLLTVASAARAWRLTSKLAHGVHLAHWHQACSIPASEQARLRGTVSLKKLRRVMSEPSTAAVRFGLGFGWSANSASVKCRSKAEIRRWRFASRLRLRSASSASRVLGTWSEPRESWLGAGARG